MKHHLVRLDRIAGELNAWLLAIAIGLGMLDMTVLIAKCLPPLPRPPGRLAALVAVTEDPPERWAPGGSSALCLLYHRYQRLPSPTRTANPASQAMSMIAATHHSACSAKPSPPRSTASRRTSSIMDIA